MVGDKCSGYEVTGVQRVMYTEQSVVTFCDDSSRMRYIVKPISCNAW